MISVEAGEIVFHQRLLPAANVIGLDIYRLYNVTYQLDLKKANNDMLINSHHPYFVWIRLIVT